MYAEAKPAKRSLSVKMKENIPTFRITNDSSEVVPIDTAGNDGSPSIAKRTKNRLSNLKTKTRTRTKRILHAADDREHSDFSSSSDSESNVREAINNNLALNPAHLQDRQEQPTSGPVEFGVDSATTARNVFLHPKTTIKNKVTKATASKLSSAQRPYITPADDRMFLEAHEELLKSESERSTSRERAQDSDDDDVVEKGGEAAKRRRRVERLKEHRDNLKAAWTTTRHVDRVRVVPRGWLRFPKMGDETFYDRSDNGEVRRWRWEKYTGYVLLYYSQDFSGQYIDHFDELPFDLDALTRCVERLIMSSAGWQAWLMAVRSTYRWEDPKHTGKWLAIYGALWYTDHMMGFLYAYIIYATLRRRFYSADLEDIQSTLDRALDRSNTAFHLGELVDRHGRSDWLEPLLEQLGPYIQLQLGDIANLLEVFSNFQTWREPRQTAYTLVFFATCLLVTLVGDWRLCMKIVWFVTGLAFFFCWPVSSRLPRYRYLVDPLKWVFWGVPTDGEFFPYDCDWV